MSYDSRPDTWEHIHQVQAALDDIIDDLNWRGHNHDRSKLRSPEREAFDEYTPKLRTTTYGSEEYEGYRKALGEALDHHYENNDHHPEHFPNGIEDMNLLQITEMLADWYAATQRHDDGDLAKSIYINAERFGYDESFARMLFNTAQYLGWV